MSLFGGTETLQARPTPEKISENDKRGHQLNLSTNPSNDADPTLEPASFKTMLIQLATGLLALMFYLLRKYQIPFMGLRIGLVYGIVPVECIILTVVLFGLGMKETATAVAFLLGPNHIGIEKEGNMDA
jgi:hypothetical protein